MEMIVQSPVLRLVILLLVFGLVVWAIYALSGIATRQIRVRAQMSAIRTTGSGPSLEGPSLTEGRRGAWWKLVELVERTGLSLTDSKPDALRTRLIAAGFESPEAPRLYTLLRLALVFLLPAAAIAFMALTGAELTLFNLYVTGATCGILGLIGPAWIVRIRADRRKEAITNGFPNCLDLMLVCVEAGLGMEAALDRISREMSEAEPQVSELLVRTTLHLRAGASREEALRRMGDLAGVDEVRSFSTLLIQSERLGTSIASTLRVFATEMRETRRMRAEEKAHRLPVLISIPLVTCMLPTMIGVLMLPAIIRVVRTLIPMMLGG